MAKKKNTAKSAAAEVPAKEKSTAKEEAESVAEPQPDSAPASTPETPETPETPVAEDRADNQQVALSGDSQDLAAQLKAAQQEIAALKSQLSSKDAEISELKQGASAGAVSSSNVGKTEDMQKLQERLAQLKKEQTEADAAREAAWRQLKSVVQEISKLSAPVVPVSASTPTA